VAYIHGHSTADNLHELKGVCVGCLDAEAGVLPAHSLACPAGLLLCVGAAPEQLVPHSTAHVLCLGMPNLGPLDTFYGPLLAGLTLATASVCLRNLVKVRTICDTQSWACQAACSSTCLQLQLQARTGRVRRAPHHWVPGTRLQLPAPRPCEAPNTLQHT
jgi:hypothetical protein